MNLHRKPFQFGLLPVFGLVTVVALLVAWIRPFYELFGIGGIVMPIVGMGCFVAVVTTITIFVLGICAAGAELTRELRERTKK